MGERKIKPLLTVSIKLKGDTWKVLLYSKASFKKLYKNCIGICEYSHKHRALSLSFMGPRVSRDTIAHELMHAYLSYKNLALCSKEEIEERVCEVLGKQHKRLYILTERIYYLFNKRH